MSQTAKWMYHDCRDFNTIINRKVSNDVYCIFHVIYVEFMSIIEYYYYYTIHTSCRIQIKKSVDYMSL